MGITIRNEVPELKKYSKYYYSGMGYYIIPDHMISEKEVKEVVRTYEDWSYIYEDTYYNFEGAPEAGVGSFVIGPKKYLEV